MGCGRTVGIVSPRRISRAGGAIACVNWCRYRQHTDQRQTDAAHFPIADQCSNSTAISAHTLAVANSSARQR
jgi:hypothetical protein